MTTPTTRRYPRSLSDAFPQERAYSVEVYRKPRGGAWWAALAVLAIVGVVALSACGGGDPAPEPEAVESEFKPYPTERNK